MRIVTILSLVALLTSGCRHQSHYTRSLDSEESVALEKLAEGSGSWDREVQVFGALRAMFHEGQIGAMVALDTLLPNPDLYGVGALSELAGEITIIAGRAFLSYPDGPKNPRTDTSSNTDAGASLLVVTTVPEWSRATINHPIPFDNLDEEIEKLSVSAGMNLGDRIPFLLEGEFEELRWHVIDGSRLHAAGTSHNDHLAASVQAKRDRASATIIGFYSANDQGVFVHMDSKTHLHCVLDDPLATGHVDHVTIPAGATIKFPTIRDD